MENAAFYFPIGAVKPCGRWSCSQGLEELLTKEGHAVGAILPKPLSEREKNKMKFEGLDPQTGIRRQQRAIEISNLPSFVPHLHPPRVDTPLQPRQIYVTFPICSTDGHRPWSFRLVSAQFPNPELPTTKRPKQDTRIKREITVSR
jgi:hypothetical protein